MMNENNSSRNAVAPVVNEKVEEVDNVA